MLAFNLLVWLLLCSAGTFLCQKIWNARLCKAGLELHIHLALEFLRVTTALSGVTSWLFLSLGA
jgi:hypothetical protein